MFLFLLDDVCFMIVFCFDINKIISKQCCVISNTYVLLLAYHIFISLRIVIPHLFCMMESEEKDE
jgi:hypothetical protein